MGCVLSCYHAHLPECAAREARTFVRMRPEDAAAYIVLGHALQMQDEFADSLEAYKTAQRLHPGYSATFEGMGRVYGQMGEFENAVSAFEQAIGMEKGNAPEYSCELAQLYSAEGYTRKAIETLEKAKSQDPDDLQVLLVLGDAHLTNEQYGAAIREYRDVLLQAPDSEIARAQLAKALRADGRNQDAERLFADPNMAPPLNNQR